MDTATEITRELFVNAYSEVLSKEYYEKLLDSVEACENKNGWIMQYHNDTVLIYDTATDEYISWYKITHIGRSLNTNINTVYDLKAFLRRILYEIFDVPEPTNSEES